MQQIYFVPLCINIICRLQKISRDHPFKIGFLTSKQNKYFDGSGNKSPVPK